MQEPSLRQRFFNWLVYDIFKVPEAQILPTPLKILYAIVFPLKWVYFTQAKYVGYQWDRQVWIIHGMQYSDALFRHFAYGDDRWYRVIKREDGIITIQTGSPLISTPRPLSTTPTEAEAETLAKEGNAGHK